MKVRTVSAAVFVVVTAVLSALVSADSGRAAPAAAAPAATAGPPADPGGLDWSKVSERDLDIASVFLAARQRGVGAALDSLDRLAEQDVTVRAQGHPLAHALGRYAMARGRDLAVLGDCKPVFQSGCFHGVLEGYFLQGGTIDRASADRICASRAAQGVRGFELLECWHGLGHGLMVHYADFRQALPICDALATAQARRECYDGVFMERAIRAIGITAINVGDGPGIGHDHGGRAHAAAAASGSAPAGAHDGHAAGAPPASAHAGQAAAPVQTKAQVRAAREQMCSGLEPAHASSCWAYQPLVLFNLLGMNPAGVLRGCDAAPGEAAADCYRGFGKQYLGALSGDAPRMIAACRLGNAARVTDCLLGGAEYFTDLDWSIEPGIAFCRQVPGEAKPRCYETIGARLVLAHPGPEPVRAACRQVETAFVGACLRGAGLRES
ncbi:MAG TPA: hypothetical protein VE871_06395 [Longimicrobium sp.]|nr:hypothetical protein [Longimicrobium sp.]